MSNDIERLTRLFIDFRNERDWSKFHTLKNLAMSLSIEVSELLEVFQWKDDKEIGDLIKSEKRYLVEEEVADIVAYLLMFCYEANIDIEMAVENKIKKNNKKYPIDKSKGNSKKYTEFQEEPYDEK